MRPRIDLGGGRDGHEQRGRRFGLVVSEDDRSWSMVTVIPTSTTAQPSASRVDIEIEGKTTLLLIDQICAIDVRHVHRGAVGPH
jgi:mRNA interferase MazF